MTTETGAGCVVVVVGATLLAVVVTGLVSATFVVVISVTAAPLVVSRLVLRVSCGESLAGALPIVVVACGAVTTVVVGGAGVGGGVGNGVGCGVGLGVGGGVSMRPSSSAMLTR